MGIYLHILSWNNTILSLTYIFSHPRSSFLTFQDLLPEDPKMYDKMRPPKKDDHPTVVHFHVTVMGIDSIDENSMVSFLSFRFGTNTFFAKRTRHFFCRRTPQIFSLLRLGRTSAWDFLKIWRKITGDLTYGHLKHHNRFVMLFIRVTVSNSGYSKWTGLRICGGLIHISRTPNLWPSKPWRYPIITYGCTRTRPFCIWWSLHYGFLVLWIFLYILTILKNASCRWKVVSFMFFFLNYFVIYIENFWI